MHDEPDGSEAGQGDAQRGQGAAKQGASADAQGHREDRVADWHDVGDVEPVDLEGVGCQRVVRS